MERGCAVGAVEAAAARSRDESAACARTAAQGPMRGRLEVGDVDDKGGRGGRQSHVQANLNGRHRRRKDGVARDGERALGPDERRQHRRRVVGGLEHDGEPVDAGARALQQELDRERAVVAEAHVRSERRLGEDGHGLRELIGRAERRQNGRSAGGGRRRIAGAAVGACCRRLDGQRL